MRRQKNHEAAGLNASKEDELKVLGVFYPSSAATEGCLPEVSSVNKESVPDHVSSFGLCASASDLEPKGLDHSGLLGQPEAAAQEECGGQRSVASYAEILLYRLVCLL